MKQTKQMKCRDCGHAGRTHRLTVTNPYGTVCQAKGCDCAIWQQPKADR